jgi:hypothetical protein
MVKKRRTINVFHISVMRTVEVVLGLFRVLNTKVWTSECVFQEVNAASKD